jgi:hypothetical protein
LVTNGSKIAITTIATTVARTLTGIALRRRRTRLERRLARAKAFSRSGGGTIAIWRAPVRAEGAAVRSASPAIALFYNAILYPLTMVW